MTGTIPNRRPRTPGRAAAVVAALALAAAPMAAVVRKLRLFTCISLLDGRSDAAGPKRKMGGKGKSRTRIRGVLPALF